MCFGVSYSVIPKFCPGYHDYLVVCFCVYIIEFFVCAWPYFFVYVFRLPMYDFSVIVLLFLAIMCLGVSLDVSLWYMELNFLLCYISWFEYPLSCIISGIMLL